jgi:hypothetical protein
MNRTTLGILAGGGSAAVGVAAGKAVGINLYAKSVAAGTPSKVAHTIAKHPWIVGAVVGAASVGVLYFTKKKDAVLPAALSAGAAILPSVVSSFVENAAFGNITDPALVAALNAQGLGVAVAERGMNGAPSVELFSAPPALQLSGASNTPNGSTSMSDGYAPVFGGQSF